MNEYHIPVLLNESLEYLRVKPGGKYIDCTLGGAGHSRAILERGGYLLAIDRDIEAIEHFRNLQFSILNFRNLTLRKGNFANLKEIAAEAGFEKVRGILMDLGVSSHQLEEKGRGFSFNAEADLDMRMDRTEKIPTAADLVNGLHENELKELFQKYGEEQLAFPISRAVARARKIKPIRTTDELAKIILSVRHRGGSDRTHPATRVFQALRIVVNDELNGLKTALPQTVGLLEPGGRLVTISFHSLEDRVVKNFIRETGEVGELKEVTKKPVEPTEEEVAKNPRARSGKLRAAEKV